MILEEVKKCLIDQPAVFTMWLGDNVAERKLAFEGDAFGLSGDENGRGTAPPGLWIEEQSTICLTDGLLVGWRLCFDTLTLGRSLSARLKQTICI